MSQNSEPEGTLFLDGVAENFKLLFTFYGPELYKHFQPHLLVMIEDKKDNPKQSVVAEIISGFMATVRTYGDTTEENRDMYRQAF